MDTTTILGYCAGTLTTLALMPQVIKIWKTKSAGDISTGMFFVFSIGIALWIAYGISIRSMPIIIANSISFVLGLTILLLKLKCR